MSLSEIIFSRIGDARRFGFKFAARTVLRRIGVSNLTVNTAGGPISVRLSESDSEAVRQVFSNLDYDPPVPEVRNKINRRIDTIVASGKTPVIIDAGANIGAATVFFAHIYKRAHVVAIEPDPSNAEMARKNCSSISNAHVIEAAVGSRTGYVNIMNGISAAGRITVPSESGCPMITIADALTTVPNGELVFCKIDIEGFEDNLFSENLEWLDEVSAVMIEPHEWMLPNKKSTRGFQKELSSRNFDLLISNENLIYLR